MPPTLPTPLLPATSPSPTLISSPTHPRSDDLSAALAANAAYNPTKIFLAVFGIIALLMFLITIGWSIWSRRQQKKTRKEQVAKDAAMAELFGDERQASIVREKSSRRGSVKDGGEVEEEDKRITRWSFTGYFRND
ncbi:hypothetical protein BU23DRAFT_565825 [Bimuria novae-zelandiae CBS 107.79]|uniref:Uncharacterized protein n=1 Tax=Bimuria novae-zelandiae CBS 107.79 TaxID=1447943 RepID=A0A6A5VJ69_9PLEO|nr:hypothetical protein BU23DRAFT_565825 [Bimuria novae-zelandiae CBS 107.79]